jgi:hypothetical protein
MFSGAAAGPFAKTGCGEPVLLSRGALTAFESMVAASESV